MPGIAVRLLLSGLAVAVAQGSLAVASLAAMGMAPTTWWLALSGALTAAVSVVAFRLLVRRPDEPRDDDRPRGNGPDDDPEPPWWPEFERAFREHAGRPPAGGREGGRVPT